MRKHELKNGHYYELAEFTRNLKKEHKKAFLEFIRTATMPMVGHQQFISVTLCEEFAREIAEKEATAASSLTGPQIGNWRNVLFSLIGPYALIMPDDDVEVIRKKVQARIDKDSLR